MILEKYDKESIGKYLNELREHILEKTNDEIEITILIEERISESCKVMGVISSSEGRAKDRITCAYKAITGDASGDFLSMMAGEVLDDLPDDILKKLKTISPNLTTKEILAAVMSQMDLSKRK